MMLPRRTVLAGALSAIAVRPLAAYAQAFSAAGHYETLSDPQPTSDPDRVEVLEVFWYGCPHCNRFQPYIEAWQKTKPDYVAYVRMPAIFRKSWEVHARAYYTALALGVLEKTHAAMFAAIHAQRRPMRNADDVGRFFAEHGVDPTAFRKAWESFAVDSGIRRSKVMQERYGIRGVPTVIVNGKYRVSGSLAGSYPNMIKVMDTLVDKEHKFMLEKA